jgi:hypothetical protein
VKIILAVSFFVLSQALSVSNGHYADKAVIYAFISCLLLGFAIFSRRFSWLDSFEEKYLTPLLFILVFRQMYQLAQKDPTLLLSHANYDLSLYKACMYGSLAVFTLGFSLFRKRWLPVYTILVALFIAGGMVVLRISPAPSIDVVEFHKSAFAFLSEWNSPYGTSIQNIYGHENFYGEGIVRNGLVQVGYPYPPPSLLLGFAAEKLLGDFRWLHLLANAAVAGLILHIFRSYQGALISLLFLFHPKTFFVLDQGWTEPLALFFFALTIASMATKEWKTRTPWYAAAFLAAKQYCVLFLPVLLARKNSAFLKTLTFSALIVGGLVFLPFVFVNFQGFLNDVVLFQIRQPFRDDSLSLLAAYKKITGAPPSGLITGTALAAALWMAVKKARNSLTYLCGAFAFVMFVFFLFAKQAFCNYYYFVNGLIAVCLAQAAADICAGKPAPCEPESPL